MITQDLWFSDTKAMTTIRNSGLLLSILLSAICVLIHYKVIASDTSYDWAAWPLAIDFLLLGLLERFWNPLTHAKIDFYVSVYTILGIANSVMLTGFNTLTFFGWLMLVIIAELFFGQRRALLTYAAMLLSLLLWIMMHDEYQTAGTLVRLLGSAFSVGAVAGVISSVLQFTVDSVAKMEASKTSEDLERSRLTSLINSMADGVIAVDIRAKVLLYNASALNILDSNSTMQHNSLGKFLQLLDKDGKPLDVVKLIRDTKVSSASRDYRLKYSDGSVANLYIAITPVHLGYGKGGNQGFVLILRDITREKSLEEERDDFISVVSHELRTPIAISEGNISNAQYIADHDPKPEALKKALKEAHNQVLFLADMINDLATLSRAERGKLVLEPEDIDIPSFAQELIHNYKLDAEQKGLELKLELNVEAGTLRNSKLYVQEILQNFITNAIKYTESGSVTLHVDPGKDGFVFKVSDTGIGISKSDQEKVFEKFFRSEDYRTRQHTGTGLGLYVTTKLARMVKAEVSLDSELNKGSTFTIMIPTIVADPADHVADPTAHPEPAAAEIHA